LDSSEQSEPDGELDPARESGAEAPSGPTSSAGEAHFESAESRAREAQRREDHELIRRAQAGEEEAFEKLVHRHEARAWRVARNMVPSDEDAQDLAQEAFLRVFKSLERFDFQHEFTTWLYRIVTNLAIDFLRKRRPQVSVSTSLDDEDAPLDLPDPRAPAPSQAMERLEIAGEVGACLEALAPHFQSVLVLREFEGLPCTEIADIVGATHVTVRWRLHRGRKLFQEEWERRERLRESPVHEAVPFRGGELADPVDRRDPGTDQAPSGTSRGGDGNGTGPGEEPTGSRKARRE
jgi:RNA polymerase sigma-70 factor (ECF subfamily)